MDNTIFQTAIQLSMALFSGAIIGFERQINNKHTKKKIGLRDFTLISLIAFLTAYFQKYTPYIWSIGFILVSLFAITFLVFEGIRKGEKKESPGMTTILSIPITYLIASLSVFDKNFWLIATLVFLMLIILEHKEKWHTFVAKFERKELFDFSILIAIAIIITPLIPEHSALYIPLYDFHLKSSSYHSINIQVFWKVVIMVSIMSFVSHFITKHIKGKNALFLKSFFGGLVSSLATIILFLKSSRWGKPKVENVFLGYLAASTGSLTKDVFILYMITSEAFFDKILLPIVSLLVVMFSFTLYAFTRSHLKSAQSTDRPLPMKFIAKFSFVFAGVIIFMTIITFYLGSEGAVVGAFISGFISSAASIASIANNFSDSGISEITAAISIFSAIIASNTAKYLFIARKIGFRDSLIFFIPILSIVGVGMLTIYISFFAA